MISVNLSSETEYSEWRDAALRLLQNNVSPPNTVWQGPNAAGSLLNSMQTSWTDLREKPKAISVPRTFPSLAEKVLCHTDPQRFAKLYRILFRLQTEPRFLSSSTEDDIIWLHECDRAISRDRHKMHAFVRFKKVGEGRFKREQFAAWFEPTHYITKLATPFFTRRFPNMDWVIITPHCLAIWDGHNLVFGVGGKKSDVPRDDAVEDQWKTYFQSIFNPARLKIGAMMSEMPKKYWQNMPETSLIPEMVSSAKGRQAEMQSHGVTEPNPLASKIKSNSLPTSSLESSLDTLAEVSKALYHCKNCELYKSASQPVPGEGPDSARLMIVGEQPGDKEDIAGQPFIGPAGQLLNDCLEEAGIVRNEVYLTNAVKHFKFVPRGKRRIHTKPSSMEIRACNPWLQKEAQIVEPDIILALGASAAQAILGRSTKLGEIRGRPLTLKSGRTLIVTYHPSYLLRLPSPEQAAKTRKVFVEDLKLAANYRAEDK